MTEQQRKNLNEMMDVSDRWSYNPITKKIVFFWWKGIYDEGTWFTAKGWMPMDLLDFKQVFRENRQSYRAKWFLNDWQWEEECPLKEN